MTTAMNLNAIRQEIDWFLDGRDPIRAARLAEALALLEDANQMTRKAEALLTTTRSATMPDEAEGRMTRQSVCQRVAPRP